MSTRIDISFQGFFGPQNESIEGPFPEILNGQMSESEWTNLCDKVDQTWGLLMFELNRKIVKMVVISCLV